MLSVTASLADGTSPYTCQWLQESPTSTSFGTLGSSFTSGCTPSSKPSISTGALTTAGNWSFELQVTDAAGETVTSSPVAVSVSGHLSSSVTITCSHSSVVVGSAVTCRVKVHSSGSVPTGNVTWSSSGSGTFLKHICRLYLGTCSVNFKPTAPGTSVILNSSYSGDTKNFPTSGTYSLIVTTKVTKITVLCTPRSVIVNSSTVITCTAKVTGYLPTGIVGWSQTASSTGSVSFNSATCTLTPLVNPNRATCFVTITGLTSGHVIINATYMGDSNNEGSHRIKAVTVKKGSAVTAISCTLSSFDITTPVTCTATVSGYSPTGTVTWSKVSGTGSVTFSSTTCMLSSGSCSVTVTATHIGSIKIKAAYGGDSNNVKSSRTIILTIT